ncbi:MAG: tRNA (guanosine(46)-N7)-methyltransferase TrmB, partial [Oscillospiraceae bacterium]
VHMEIGCGKGRFAREIAKRYPDINFIAVEKSSNVIVEAAEKALEEDIPNLYFLRGGAEYLECYIPEHSISRIYLNFSCPFQKKSYAAHRLTHRKFLAIYDRLLVEHGEIHQKTDNQQLFEFSIEEFSQSGYKLKNVTFDLHNSDFEGNIQTEYETRFSEQGMPIYRLEAYK